MANSVRVKLRRFAEPMDATDELVGGLGKGLSRANRKEGREEEHRGAHASLQERVGVPAA